MLATCLNLASLLDHQAGATPERTAIVCGPQRLTYAQFHGRVCQLAAGLRAMGVGPGDHIALSCPNTPHFPIAYYAILKLGGVVVPLNVLLKPREIAYHLQDSDAKALLVFEGTAELPMAQMAREACSSLSPMPALLVMTLNPLAPNPPERASASEPRERSGDPWAPASERDGGAAGAKPPGLTMSQVMHGHPAAYETHPSAANDTAVILYTSGTTGQPKGAELTHLNMTLNAIASRDLVLPLLDGGVDARNTSLVTLPLFHSFGQTTLMNAGIAGGFTLVLLPRPDPAATLKALAEEHVSYWAAVPTMFWTLLQHARATGVNVSTEAASLRVCMSGGAPLPLQLLRDVEQSFGVRVLEGYGLSETSPVATFNQVFRPCKPGTVGFPIAGCEIRVVDEHDQPVPPGTRGEVVIRGHNLMKGYYKRPAETADALRGGWFHTGDIGVLDDDGYLSIVDRKKDLIIRGGLNVYPREIEEVLLTHPAVSLAAVIGVPDDRLGEEVRAYIVRKPGSAIAEEELIGWCREQMAAFKYPRSIEFRDSLPMGGTGKVLKRELKLGMKN